MPLYIVRDNIAKMRVDAIVNLANTWPEVDNGIESIIYGAAGYNELLRARKRVGVINKGKAAVTPGFRLPALSIVHTVAAKWDGGNWSEEKILRQCIRASLDEVIDLDYETAAIPFHSDGILGFPKNVAIDVVLEEIRSFVNDNDITVYLVVYDDEDLETYKEELTARKHQRKLNFFFDVTEAEDADNITHAICYDDVLETPLESVCNECSSVLIDSKGEEELPAEKPCFKFNSALDSLDDILSESSPSFIDILLKHIAKKDLDRVTVYTRANLDRKRFSKLINGRFVTPSKNMVLALVIGLRLDIEEAKEFMSYAGYAFNPSDRTDRVVLYNMNKGNYDIDRINFDLYDNDLPSLGINVG